MQQYNSYLHLETNPLNAKPVYIRVRLNKQRMRTKERKIVFSYNSGKIRLMTTNVHRFQFFLLKFSSLLVHETSCRQTSNNISNFNSRSWNWKSILDYLFLVNHSLIHIPTFTMHTWDHSDIYLPIKTSVSNKKYLKSWNRY